MYTISSNKNQDSIFYYDSLVIATGARAISPRIDGLDKRGRIAGENAARGDAIFRGIAESIITKTFDLYVGRTGLSTEEALQYGYEPITKTIKSATRAGYYPGRKKLWVNLIMDKRTELLLGAQIVGGEGVKGRIDLVALALMLKATISDLASYDACYVPPVSPVWEPLNIAASQVYKLNS